MRGMAPGENKFHREIAKTEFSQQGRKGRGYFTARPQRPQRSDNLKQEEREATEEEKLRPGFIRRNPPFTLLPHVKMIRLCGLCGLAVKIVL